MGRRIENDKVNLGLWRHEGSHQALDKLIVQYEQNIFSFVLYLSGCDWNMAYEITADCFSETLAALKTSAEETLSGQLFTRAMDKCLNTEAIPLFDPVKLIDVADPKKHVLRTAKEGLNALPFDEKVMLLLRDQANLSYEEIARIMKISIEDIKTRTWQARNNFRNAIEGILDRDRSPDETNISPNG